MGSDDERSCWGRFDHASRARIRRKMDPKTEAIEPDLHPMHNLSHRMRNSEAVQRNPSGTEEPRVSSPARERFVLCAAALFFLSYQLYLSWSLWQHTGNVPPGFDDSYSYIFDIGKVIEYESLLPRTVYPPRYSHLKDLSYNYLMASMASVLDVRPERVYELSFVAGKLVLLAFLLRLLVTLDKDLLVVAGSLGALAAFSGTPEFHGFYWVVPSFWLLCLFFFWISELAGPSRGSGLLLLGSGFLGGTMHALGPYLVAPLGVFLLFSRALDRGDPAWRTRCQSFFWIAAGALAAALIPNLLAILPQYGDIRAAPPHAVIWLGGGWPDLDSEGSAAADARTISLLPGYAGVFRSYLRFVLFPPLLAFLLVALGLLVHSRRFRLLALFLATLAFTLATMVHPYASRTCLFLWPSTLMVLGAAPALGWRLVSSTTRRRGIRRAFAGCAAGAAVVFVIAWHAYNLTLIEAHRRFGALQWDESCAGYLLARTEANRHPVFYGSKYAVSAFLTQGLHRRQALPLSELSSAAQGLGSAEKIWAVLDDPGSSVPQAEDKFRVVETLRESGLDVERRECGLFVVMGFSRP